MSVLVLSAGWLLLLLWLARMCVYDSLQAASSSAARPCITLSWLLLLLTAAGACHFTSGHSWREAKPTA
jgi:hypothetical protein